MSTSTHIHVCRFRKLSNPPSERTTNLVTKCRFSPSSAPTTFDFRHSSFLFEFCHSFFLRFFPHVRTNAANAFHFYTDAFFTNEEHSVRFMLYKPVVTRQTTSTVSIWRAAWGSPLSRYISDVAVLFIMVPQFA